MTVKVGWKVFTAEACKNNWGQFLRQTEDVDGRKNSVCIPREDVDKVAA